MEFINWDLCASDNTTSMPNIRADTPHPTLAGSPDTNQTAISADKAYHFAQGNAESAENQPCLAPHRKSIPKDKAEWNRMATIAKRKGQRPEEFAGKLIADYGIEQRASEIGLQMRKPLQDILENNPSRKRKRIDRGRMSSVPPQSPNVYLVFKSACNLNPKDASDEWNELCNHSGDEAKQAKYNYFQGLAALVSIVHCLKYLDYQIEEEKGSDMQQSLDPNSGAPFCDQVSTDVRMSAFPQTDRYT